MQTTTTIQTTSLHFREGNSDKVYHVAIEAKGDGHIVTFAYGRRGNTLSTGSKTGKPVPLETATRLFDKLLASKLAKGYRHADPMAAPYQQSGTEGNDSGIRCQLLNPVEQNEIYALLSSRNHCLQEKFDGRRLMVRKLGDEITGINRRGLVVAIPDSIREAASAIGHNFLIDGEAVGDTFHAFDLLELDNHDQRTVRYIDRFVRMQSVLPRKSPAIRPVETYMAPTDKHRVFQKLHEEHREGVVFKHNDAAFSPGRPNSGGSQLKFKFVETASFIVTARNEKRSVTLCLFDGDELAHAGNVTIPPNHAVPAVGEVVEVRYLYAFRESGSIYQPVYLGKRCDIPQADCITDQLKYKSTCDVAV